MVYVPSAHCERPFAPAEIAPGYNNVAAARIGQPEKLSLWVWLTTVKINPLNKKCTTLPVLSLNNPYSINFHLFVYLLALKGLTSRTAFADLGSVSGSPCESVACRAKIAFVIVTTA
jgi:hypothetical protein